MWLSRKSSPRTKREFLEPCTAVFALAALLLLSCGGDPTAGSMESATKPSSSVNAVTQLMPAAGVADGWTPDGEPTSFPGDSLFEHINGGADIYYEYGFVTLVVQEYRKGEKAVSVEIYCMDDPSSAFGIYSYNRHPTLSAVEVGGDGTIHSSGLFFWQDRYYVDIRQLGSTTIFGEEFLALAKAIEKNIGDTPGTPAAMKLLPRENMVPRSEVLALGLLGVDNQVYVANEDLFGLAEGEFAAIARYRLGQPECSVIVAQYAGPDACSQAFVRFREHFLGTESTREQEFVAKAMPSKYHGVRRAGGRLIVVANADNEKNALDMLNRVSAWQQSQTSDESPE